MTFSVYFVWSILFQIELFIRYSVFFRVAVTLQWQYFSLKGQIKKHLRPETTVK